MNKEIYFKILTWITQEVLGTPSVLRLYNGQSYVSIQRTMNMHEIQINHYIDDEFLLAVDGGGGLDMSDEFIIDDMKDLILSKDIKSVQAYLQSKADLIYDLTI